MDKIRPDTTGHAGEQVGETLLNEAKTRQAEVDAQDAKVRKAQDSKATH